MLEQLRRGRGETIERLQTALGAAGMGAWEWNIDTGEVRWSETLEAIHGLVPGTFGGTFEDFRRDVHPDDLERVLAAITNAVDGRGTYDVEYRVVWPDRSIHWLHAKGSVIRDEQGRAVQMAGVCMNIDERKMAERLSDARYAVTRVLAEAGTLADAAPRIIRAICERLEWDVGAIWEVDPSRGGLHCVDLWRAPGVEAPAFEDLSRSIIFERGVGLPGRVWESGRPAWIPDVFRDLNFPRGAPAEEAGLHGAFAFPIRLGPRVTGAVEFFSHEIREPDNALLALADSVGSQLGQYVERKRLEDELRLQKTLLEAQSEASIDGILVVSSTGRLILFNRRLAELWGIPEDTIASRSDEAALGVLRGKLVDPEGFIERVAYLYAHPDAESRDEIELLDGRVFDLYSAPVRGDDGTHYGRVLFFRDITADKRHQEGLRFLAESSVLLSESLDFEEALKRVAELAVHQLSDWCAVDVLDERGRLRRLALEHVDPEKRRLAWELYERYPPDRDSPVGPAEVVRTGRPELVGEISNSLLEAATRDKEQLRIARELGLRSYVCVPVRGHRGMLGALTFATAESRRTYGRETLALAQDVARHAALAIENARLYQERSRVAETLQRSLLPPQLPEIPGVEIAARYSPAAVGLDVGGDFYDAFEVDVGVFGFVIGDVCGKGAEAAALTGLARHTIRTAAMRERSPSRVLRMLNDAIRSQHRGEGTFCTVVYGLLEPGEGVARATIACGGHPLPLALRVDGFCEPAAEPGTLIGFFPEPELAERVVELGSGDALVLYTDGVVPRPDQEAELRTRLEASAGLDAARLADEVARVPQDEDGSARDDVAVLVLRISAA